MSKSIQFDFQFCLLSTDNNITIALYFVIFSFVSMPNMDNLAEYLFKERARISAQTVWDGDSWRQYTHSKRFEHLN